jgi:hypothetical protein
MLYPDADKSIAIENTFSLKSPPGTEPLKSRAPDAQFTPAPVIRLWETLSAPYYTGILQNLTSFVTTSVV